MLLWSQTGVGSALDLGRLKIPRRYQSCTRTTVGPVPTRLRLTKNSSSGDTVGLESQRRGALVLSMWPAWSNLKTNSGVL